MPSGIMRVLEMSPTILAPGQVPADARLCTLSHFDLNGRAGFQIILVHAEAPGSHLHDGVGAILVEVLMQAALAGIIVGSQRLRPPGPGLRGRYS